VHQHYHGINYGQHWHHPMHFASSTNPWDDLTKQQSASGYESSPRILEKLTKL